MHFINTVYETMYVLYIVRPIKTGLWANNFINIEKKETADIAYTVKAGYTDIGYNDILIKSLYNDKFLVKIAIFY